MLHLAFLPVVVLSFFIMWICKNYKAKVGVFIARIVFIVSLVLFIYTYVAYLGFDIVAYVIGFFK